MRLDLWCVLLVEILDRLCSHKVVLVRELSKERKMGKIVNVSVSTWYHGPNDCI